MLRYQIPTLAIAKEDARRHGKCEFGDDLSPVDDSGDNRENLAFRVVKTTFLTMFLTAGASASLRGAANKLPPGLNTLFGYSIFALSFLLSLCVCFFKPKQRTAYSQELGELVRDMQVHNELVKDLEVAIDNAIALGTASIANFDTVIAKLKCNRTNLLRCLEYGTLLSDFRPAQPLLTRSFDLSPTVAQPLALPERQPNESPEETLQVEFVSVERPTENPAHVRASSEIDAPSTDILDADIFDDAAPQADDILVEPEPSAETLQEVMTEPSVAATPKAESPTDAVEEALEEAKNAAPQDAKSDTQSESAFEPTPAPPLGATPLQAMPETQYDRQIYERLDVAVELVMQAYQQRQATGQPFPEHLATAAEVVMKAYEARFAALRAELAGEAESGLEPQEVIDLPAE